MKVLTMLSLFIMFSFSQSVKAQTADDIVHKWLDAMGGRDKLSKIQTLYAENDVTIMNNPGTSKTYAINGKGFKSETDFGGQKIIDCYTVNGGWNINPLAGQPTAAAMPASQVKFGQLSLQLAGPLFDYAAKGNKVELQGKGDVNGSSAYKIMLTTADSIPILFYIGDKTYYILKETMKTSAGGQDLEISTIQSDYRKTQDGYVMSYSQEINAGGLVITIVSKKIEINQEIPATIFEMPKN
jgi:hypothetical protein